MTDVEPGTDEGGSAEEGRNDVLTDDEIEASWGLPPASSDGTAEVLRDLTNLRVQGAARLGTLSQVAGKASAAKTFRLLNVVDRKNATGLRLIGRGAFGR